MRAIEEQMRRNWLMVCVRDWGGDGKGVEGENDPIDIDNRISRYSPFVMRMT